MYPLTTSKLLTLLRSGVLDADSADGPWTSERVAEALVELGGGGGPGGGAWGDITGTLADQTDLQAALDAKSAVGHTHGGVYQPVDADLTALAGLNATAGLVEQTGAAAFTKRLVGVASGSSILTRDDGDLRYDISGLATVAYVGATQISQPRGYADALMLMG